MDTDLGVQASKKIIKNVCQMHHVDISSSNEELVTHNPSNKIQVKGLFFIIILYIYI